MIKIISIILILVINSFSNNLYIKQFENIENCPNKNYYLNKVLKICKKENILYIQVHNAKRKYDFNLINKCKDKNNDIDNNTLIMVNKDLEINFLLKGCKINKALLFYYNFKK